MNRKFYFLESYFKLFAGRNLNLNDLDLNYLTFPTHEAANTLKNVWPEASLAEAADNSDIESDGDDFDW